MSGESSISVPLKWIRGVFLFACQRRSGYFVGMSKPTVATIGVYGASLGTFLDALLGADVTLVLDVRQRRGVRGRE